MSTGLISELWLGWSPDVNYW